MGRRGWGEVCHLKKWVGWVDLRVRVEEVILGHKNIDMNRYLVVLTLLLGFGMLEARQEIPFNTGWRFALGERENAQALAFDDRNWTDVRLPHDWAIGGAFDPELDGNTGKLPWRGEGWYRKRFQMPAGDAGQRIYFLFDGIMAFPKIYVNGKLAGEWDYGYNSFYLDVTDLIRFGAENLMAIHVDTRRHGSRWYPGAGIYRKITMIKTDPVHIPVWGTYVTTPEVTDTYADVQVRTEVRNATGDSVEVVLRATVYNPDGKMIVQETSRSRKLAPGVLHTFDQWFTLTRPQRWDIDHPVRYRMRTEVLVDDRKTDDYTTPFGIRTFKYTPNDGFYLNGRRVQMKGVNLHHDHGPLGARFLPRAMERQLEIMQEMGCNAIRSSHNVPAPELLEMCDSMGLLVFDEAFDKWDDKADILPGTDFGEFMERQFHNFIKRDRNHPSVVIWSVGNEMRDVQGNINNGLDRLHTAVNIVRKYDPTRPVTMANDQMNNVKWRHWDYYDIHSWNYGRRYRPAREKDPSEPVIISESASTVSTRDFYELPLPEEKSEFTDSRQVSSYDLNAPPWAEPADWDFYWQEEDRYVVGEYVWTGFDYLGEPTPYHDFWARMNELPQSAVSRSSYFGIVDLVGIPKDRFYLYRSYWAPEKYTLHILPHWNWEGKEGENVPVFVYTNSDAAELFVNGESQGMRRKKPKSDNPYERYRLMWKDVVYQPGELRVVAYREGAVIGETVKRTAGEAAEIRLQPDRTEIRADGQDLCYVLVEVYDEAGNPCPKAMQEITFEAEGPADIAGVGNGNPQSHEPLLSDKVRLFYGKAMLILQSREGETGTVRVRASSEGLEEARMEIIIRE